MSTFKSLAAAAENEALGLAEGFLAQGIPIPGKGVLQIGNTGTAPIKLTASEVLLAFFAAFEGAPASIQTGSTAIVFTPTPATVSAPTPPAATTPAASTTQSAAHAAV